MTRRAEQWAVRGLLGIAGLIVSLDWFLPSNLTLFFDELAMMGLLWAMRQLWLLSTKNT